MLAAAFTLLPALLSVLGERAFWPGRPARGRDAGRHTPLGRGSPGWCGGARGLIVLAVFAGLIVLALGNLTHHGTIGFGQGETRPTNSSRGTAVLNEHFPPGIGSPLTAVVKAERRRPGGRRDEEARRGPAGAAGAADRAAATRRWSSSILRGNPYSGEAADAVEEIRERLHADRPQRPARRHPGRELRHRADQRPRHQADRAAGPARRRPDPGRWSCARWSRRLPDRSPSSPPSRRRSASAPSPSRELGSEGVAFNLVLLSFLFLVALGVDYNIFLMARAREEAAGRGTREGDAGRPRQHRRRRHRRRPDPRRHLRHPDPAAARGAGPDRRHGRDRRPPRHLRRPRPADPGDHLPARRAHLVAVARAQP